MKLMMMIGLAVLLHVAKAQQMQGMRVGNPPKGVELTQNHDSSAGLMVDKRSAKTE
jgi:hypothetical protein